MERCKVDGAHCFAAIASGSILPDGRLEPLWLPFRNQDLGSEADLRDAKIKLAAGDWFDFMSYLPPYAANHQITYRIADTDIHDLRRSLNQLFDHGKPIRIVLEQPAERKRDYSQFMDARSQFHEGPEVGATMLSSVSECQRSLKFSAVGTWQVLGEPGAQGWSWQPNSLVQAKLRDLAFLGSPSPETTDGEPKESDRAGRAGEERHRAEDDFGEDRQPDSSPIMEVGPDGPQAS